MHNLKAILGEISGRDFFFKVCHFLATVFVMKGGWGGGGVLSFWEASAASSLQITSPVFPISPLPSSEYIYPEEEGGEKKTPKQLT